MRLTHAWTGLVILFLFSLFAIPHAHASTTDGTIDPSSRYVWSETVGWIDLGTSQGNVHVTDSALSGYIWNDNIGWISFNCSNDSSCGTIDYKVSNDGNGHLSGYAWSETVGWIDFAPAGGGVSIDSSGDFSGYAWNDDIGWIVFDCATRSSCGTIDYKAATDWRPASVRSSGSGSSGSSVGSPPGGGSISSSGNAPVSFLSPIIAPVQNLVQGVKNVVNNILGHPPNPPPTAESSTTAPIAALSNAWNLVDPSVISNFVLAPLPNVLLNLASAYPTLGKVFSDLGVKTIADLSKLEGTSISIPTISNLLNLPAGILAAKTSGNLDVNSSVAVDANGNAEQKIQTTSNAPLTLAVRPGAPADSVTGYLIFQSAKPEAAALPLNMETASVLSAIESTAAVTPAVPPAQLVLQTFSYTDPKNTGVYTATITTPATAGNYQVITLITYHDPTLGTKELSLTTVIDPEGYVYELINGKEAHIAKATVSLYDANTGALWNATKYNQINPQTTDTDGRYSFLVPEGSYYIMASAAGYEPYKGDVFSVTQGSGVHFNIQMTSVGGWLANMDWETAFFVLLILVICSTFAGYAIHEHALKRELRRQGRL